MPRVEIHSQAPDFSLKDLNGKTITLSEFQGHKNVVLVFNRGFT
jgi:mycoredoxin-dependent peroxiredoxin